MQFSKKLLSLAVCTVVTGVTVPMVYAQDATVDEALVEEVVVRGMRQSIESAQDMKRFADTVKDVITASDIGALPDKSVTEALQRVPGVTIERFASSDDPKHYADEGTGVLVRGLDRVRSEVNGRDAFSANPYGGLNYEDFPAELLGAVEVVKNQTADKISGGIAGTVNLISRKPFDSDDQIISFTAKGNYGDYREEWTPSFSALFSDSWETSAGRFGFLVSGAYSEYKTRGDGVGLGNFHSRSDEYYRGSWDEWGTLQGAPGKVEGYYDGPCVPNALGWMPECDGVPADLITAETAEAPPVDGDPLPGQPAGEVWYVPANYHLSTAENDRERQGLTASLQWANNDETIVTTLEHISSEASLEWRERVIASGDRGFVSGTGNAVVWTEEDGRPITTTEDGFLTSGVGANADINFPLQFRSRWNYNEDTVEDTSFNVELNPTTRLKVVLDYQHVDSTQTTHNYNLTSRVRGDLTAEVAPFFLDLRGDTPTIEYLNSRVSDPTINTVGDAPNPDLYLGNGMQQEVRSDASMDAFKIDLEYTFDGPLTAIKGGVYYSDKELEIGDTEYSNWTALGTPWVQGDRYNASPQQQPDLFERVSFADHYNGEVVQGEYNSFLFPRMDLVEDFANTLRDGCGVWNAVGNASDGSGRCGIPYEDMNNRIDGPFSVYQLSSSGEERTEAYIRGDFEFDNMAMPLRGNIGLRYVSYQLESTGFEVLPPVDKRGTDSLADVIANDYPDLYALADGSAEQSTVQGTDYDTVLPSLNLSLGLTDDLVLRFAASKALYYPSLLDSRNSMVVSLDYENVLQDPSSGRDEETNPVVGLEDIEITAVSRNPYLEPEESVNLDLTLEWYFAPVGSVSLALFQKDLDNIIRNKTFAYELEHAGYTYPVSAYGPDNTGSGTIRGAEFSYQQFYDFLPGAWSGLGLQFNYTYIDQDGLEDPLNESPADLIFNNDGSQVTDNRNSFRVFSGLPLQGYSDENLNIVGMYEYGDVSLRVAYNWRSEYLLTRRESEEFVPAYAEPVDHLDASFYYTINDNWKVGIEGSNLLNSETKTQYQLNQEGDKTQALSFTTDRRYALSVRATF
ncbi:TonB-dependent receptor [Gilvimarinus chinensis]|uniref:TonB-dependent receptor n=1 Tax=Gilvimarinus chinensis TaxID=396005 RepID=UPI00035F6B56|nr:TonB-dependent receptor [Gilvimarinus chinensis]